MSKNQWIILGVVVVLVSIIVFITRVYPTLGMPNAFSSEMSSGGTADYYIKGTKYFVKVAGQQPIEITRQGYIDAHFIYLAQQGLTSQLNSL